MIFIFLYSTEEPYGTVFEHPYKDERCDPMSLLFNVDIVCTSYALVILKLMLLTNTKCSNGVKCCFFYTLLKSKKIVIFKYQKKNTKKKLLNILFI